jgi:hypothetical protein
MGNLFKLLTVLAKGPLNMLVAFVGLALLIAGSLGDAILGLLQFPEIELNTLVCIRVGAILLTISFFAPGISITR